MARRLRLDCLIRSTLRFAVLASCQVEILVRHGVLRDSCSPGVYSRTERVAVRGSQRGGVTAAAVSHVRFGTPSSPFGFPKFVQGIYFLMRRENASGLSEGTRAWVSIRARGRRRYIWYHGVLRWGGFMFCFSLAIYQYRQFGSVISTEGHLWFRMAFGALVWTYVGYLYGRASWHQNEREFNAIRGDGGTSIEL